MFSCLVIAVCLVFLVFLCMSFFMYLVMSVCLYVMPFFVSLFMCVCLCFIYICMSAHKCEIVYGALTYDDAMLSIWVCSESIWVCAASVLVCEGAHMGVLRDHMRMRSRRAGAGRMVRGRGAPIHMYAAKRSGNIYMLTNNGYDA